MLTLTGGGFSEVGGTESTLRVQVGNDQGNSVDLSTAADPLAFVSVDEFALMGSAELKLTGLQASTHTISGNGTVTIVGDITSGWVDLTKIATPLYFANSVNDED